MPAHDSEQTMRALHNCMQPRRAATDDAEAMDALTLAACPGKHERTCLYRKPLPSTSSLRVGAASSSLLVKRPRPSGPSGHLPRHALHSPCSPGRRRCGNSPPTQPCVAVQGPHTHASPRPTHLTPRSSGSSW